MLTNFNNYKNDLWLWLAIENDSFDAFKTLIIDADLSITKHGKTVLTYLIDYLRYDMIEFLLQNRYDVEIDKDTLLNIINYGQMKLIKLLYPIIDINTKFDGVPLLLLAAHKGNFWLINKLLEDDVILSVFDGKIFIDYLKKLPKNYHNASEEIKKIKEKFPIQYQKAIKLKKSNRFNL